MVANITVNWFFLSYARHDRETAPDGKDFVKQFYEDLNRDLLQLEPQVGAAGFFDDKGIQTGSSWKPVLNQALANCRVLICVYSPAFFRSEYCGKEWQVFSSRLDNYLVDGEPAPPPPLILPVLFNAPEDMKGLFPDVAKDIQRDDGDYPDDYRENGLRYLLQRDSKKEDYQDFRDALIRKIRNAANDYPLSDLKVLPNVDLVESAFLSKSVPVVAQRQQITSLTSSAAGARFANFVYVAASRTEMKNDQVVKTNLDYYGDLGGLDWKPYLQDDSKEVISIAQRIADQESFIHLPVSIDDKLDLSRLIDEAKNKNRIVVILVDTWTLFIQKYRELMQHYDNVPLTLNCVVLILWNTKDDEIDKNRTKLEDSVRWSLMTVSDIKDERYFLNLSGSLDDFTKALSITLSKKRQQLNEAAEFAKRIETNEVFTKPELATPGGN